MARKRLKIEVVVDDGRKSMLTNQAANFIRELKQVGSKGITKADYPGLHVGDIVMRIRRKLGDDIILCEMEPNTGPWGGEHGRYRLNAKISIKEVPYPEKKKPASVQTGLALISEKQSGRLMGSNNG